MSELTREQVKKALECCASPEYKCEECPIDKKLKDDCECGKFLAQNALAIFKLQEQDIADRDKMLEGKVEDIYADFMADYKEMRKDLEEYSTDLTEMHRKNKRLTEENERLQAEITHLEGHRKSDIKAVENLKELLDEKCDRCIARDKAAGALETVEYLEDKGLLNVEPWGISDLKAELKRKYEEGTNER